MAIQDVPGQIKSLVDGIGSRGDNTPLTKPEIKALLDESKGKVGMRAILLLGLNSGISLKEALDLRVTDIYYAEYYILVWDAGKNRYRRIYLPSDVLGSLKAFQDHHRRILSNRLFDTSEDTVLKKLGEATKKAILKQKTWKAIRRTWLELAMQKGMSIKDMSESCGLTETALTADETIKKSSNGKDNKNLNLLEGIL